MRDTVISSAVWSSDPDVPGSMSGPRQAQQPTSVPIDTWGDWLTADVQDLGRLPLAELYSRFWPTQGELIFTGGCEFECQHCIYPPDYGRFNAGLPPEAWERVFRDLVAGLGMTTFVCGGRAVTRDGVEALARLRAVAPDGRIGMIDNGISFVPHRERLAELRLDWIDVSLDGDEAAHDRQRGRPGSFRAGLAGAQWLMTERIAPRVNILTCLTVLNAGTVTSMMSRLNAEGFKNFFVTPVSVAEPRPLRHLVVEAAGFAAFVESLARATESLNDAHLEVEIHDVRYLRFLLEFAPGLLRNGLAERDHIRWVVVNGATPLYVNYYPLSLSGTRELIVNTNADVVAPKAMAWGRVPRNAVVGNLMAEPAAALIRRLPESPAFTFFEAELEREREALEAVRHQLAAAIGRST